MSKPLFSKASTSDSLPVHDLVAWHLVCDGCWIPRQSSVADLTFSFGLQIAVASGATVIATSSSDEKLEVAKKLGAKHTINYNTTPEWDQEVLRIVRHVAT